MILLSITLIFKQCAGGNIGSTENARPDKKGPRITRGLTLQDLHGKSYTHKLYICRKYFSRATFALLIVCFYLEPLTMLKNTQKCNIFRLMGGAPGALPVELMLSSNWHVTLWLTVFEIFAAEWLTFRPTIWNFGEPLGVPPAKGKTSCPEAICTIVQNFTPIGATVSEISVTGQWKKHSNQHQPAGPLYHSILRYAPYGG